MYRIVGVICLYHLKISKNVYGCYDVMQYHARFKSSNNKKSANYWTSYENKLNNNISRAISNVYNIASYNKFGYFYTQTISSIYNRSDLNRLIKQFSNIVRYIRKEYKGNFYYLVIPEYHSDDCNWHLHGLLSEDFVNLIYKNKNNFDSLKHLDKIGFNSISRIKNYSACIKYITKYISKDIYNTFNKGDRLYFCSQKLSRCNVVTSGFINHIAPIHYDYKNEYCFKTTINENKYYNLITNIDSNNHLFYNEDVLSN